MHRTDLRELRNAARRMRYILPLLPVLGCGSSNVTGLDNPPIVSIQSPSPGASVSPVGFFVSAEAGDDRGLSQVEVRLDDTMLMATLSAEPFETYITTLGLAAGNHKITVTAVDDANQRRDAVSTVNVRPRSYRQLTAANGNQHLEPAWSPASGSQIAYAEQPAGPVAAKNIYIISSSVTQGTGQQLTFSALQDGNPTFSPDGVWIAFESNRNVNYQIYAVRAGGGGLVQLTSVGAADQRRPSWGPSSGFESWLVYDTNRAPASNTRRDLYMIKVASDNDTVVIVEPTEQPDLPADTNVSDDVAPSWSSSSFLAVNSNRSSGLYSVTVLDPFFLEARVVNGTSQILVTSYAPSFSPLDTHVAFVERVTGQEKAFVVPVDGPGNIRYEIAPGADGFPNASDPAWSPDGGRIAFVSTLTGIAEIWILE